MNFNPEGLRLGNKVLRQRLRGPALASWYPKKTVSFRDMQDTFRPLGLTMFDEFQDDREEAIQMYVLLAIIHRQRSHVNYSTAVRNLEERADRRRRGQQKVRFDRALHFLGGSLEPCTFLNTNPVFSFRISVSEEEEMRTDTSFMYLYQMSTLYSG